MFLFFFLFFFDMTFFPFTFNFLVTYLLICCKMCQCFKTMSKDRISYAKDEDTARKPISSSISFGLVMIHPSWDKCSQKSSGSVCFSIFSPFSRTQNSCVLRSGHLDSIFSSIWLLCTEKSRVNQEEISFSMLVHDTRFELSFSRHSQMSLTVRILMQTCWNSQSKVH